MARKQSDALRIVILVVWIAGFVVGTTTHVMDLVAGGVDAYAGFPPGVRVFWMSLTLLDPITVVLLALRRRAGIVLALVVILADIAVNWTVFASIGIPLFGVVNQTLFAIVLVSTAPVLWRWFGQK
ncbi:MAG TPA: hypothetical protein VGE78_08130 [Agromyces sp.]